jgi:basic membrane protein A and related proteins
MPHTRLRLPAAAAVVFLLACLAAAGRPSPLRVAMLSDGGSFSDNSFNQTCRYGVEALLYAEAPIFAQFVETDSREDFRRKLAAYAERDYRLLIGIGYRMADAIKAVAADYPRTWFAIVDANYEHVPHNVWALTFRVDECAFPAGYLAAAWAALRDPADPAVAWVGGKDVDSVNQFAVAFAEGARHYNQANDADVRVLGQHVGSFEDFEGGRETALAFFDDGADVVFGVGSVSGNGAIAAAKERGKWAIGVDTDQYYTLLDQQDVLLTSCLKRMDVAVQKTVRAAIDNQFWGGTRYVGTLVNHGVGLAPFHDFESQIPEPLKKELHDVQRRIMDGTLSTGWPPAP